MLAKRAYILHASPSHLPPQPLSLSLSLALTQPPTRPLRRPFGKRAIYDHFNLVATLPLPRALSLSLARSEQTLRGKRGTNSYQVRGGLLGERTNPECAAFSSKKYPSSSNAIQVFSFWILRRRITPGTDGRGVSGFIRVGAQASFIKVGTAFHSLPPLQQGERG